MTVKPVSLIVYRDCDITAYKDLEQTGYEWVAPSINTRTSG